MLYERDDSAVVPELHLAVVAQIFQHDLETLVEERQLAQPPRDGVEVELEGFKDLVVRLERHLRAAPLGRSCLSELGNGFAALVRLLVDTPGAPDLEVQTPR